MYVRKCCSHCPGTWTSSQHRGEYDCNLPTYIKGNLKLSSMEKCVPGEVERSERLRGNPSKTPPSRQNSCNERFAIAKKFHSENLQHQPLPDKVDDSVFKNIRVMPGKCQNMTTNRMKNRDSILKCQSQVKDCHKLHANIQYGSALGCKIPSTNMDLAICWEAPSDPCYEPPWPAHIDGSAGYPGPAIFTQVQHESDGDVTYKSPVERFEAKFCNVKNRCVCNQPQSSDPNHNCHQVNHHNDDHDYKPIADDLPLYNNSHKKQSKSSADLCQDLNAIHITEDHRLVKSGYLLNPRKRQPVHLRNCSPCPCRGDRSKRQRSPLIHSAPPNLTMKYNGLPVKSIVPRPRTPYAKREYCIDTLTPPFNIIEGCRDADYPEHWRLTSVYQQSYRNPKKRINATVNC